MEGYQVIRMFLMIVEMRKGMKAKPAYLEIGSYWIAPKGGKTVVGLQRTLGYYIDSFAFGSPLGHKATYLCRFIRLLPQTRDSSVHRYNGRQDNRHR